MDELHMNPSNGTDLPEWIPLFPLPNVVLLPRTVLPLHVFEERYRAMTRDALAGSRLIALALLKPGYEADYHTLHARIHSVVCVGRICREERLPDGRYNFLLEGLCRARVIREDTQRKYRRAMLQPLQPPRITPHAESVHRCELQSLLTEAPLDGIAREAHWLDLLRSSDLGFSDLLDVLASAVLSCHEERQRFLEESCISRRTRRLCAALRDLASSIRTECGRPESTRDWPPVYCAN